MELEPGGKPGLNWYAPPLRKSFQCLERMWRAGEADGQEWFVIQSGYCFTDEEVQEEIARGIAERRNRPVNNELAAKRQRVLRRIRRNLKKLDNEGES